MEYYTQKNKLILTEYGRNIQQMVEYAMTIEDRDERTRCVHTIINIMGNLFPHLRDVNDFKHKLWDHLAMMSNYKLDIDYPYEVPKELVLTKPEPLPYPETSVKYRYYGQQMIQFIKAVEDYNGDNKDKLVTLLANHMKKCFLTWNKDNVDDQKIFNDLREISNGKIDLNEETIKLKETKDILANNNKKIFVNGKNRQKQQGRK
ncbi:MAG TPA: DUF4290 domain-containing protein [Candidatus Enterocola sp.]|jgi:hypothetical protein|nr:MAG: hypothetical protein BWY47_01182 [Bacteroidetes bacterium ADurb.Bin302]HOH95631.1 DUF4290 domain-containing protein [Candidatus Enterocola sp.]HPG54924.1 DUF4290 domain-containing protein [Candidatus Enterocola sp.]